MSQEEEPKTREAAQVETSLSELEKLRLNVEELSASNDKDSLQRRPGETSSFSN